MAALPNADAYFLREVWDHNLEYEFSIIREIIDHYPYVAMDTEFPGVVTDPQRPLNPNLPMARNDFLKMRYSVDNTNLIQLGLTLSDANGNLPMFGNLYSYWQFNFREFDQYNDPSNEASIKLLRSSGIAFDRFRRYGVSSFRFAELLMSSGLVMNDEVRWLAFHSVYDFAYLLKLLTGRRIPESRQSFLDVVWIYFPGVVFDVKHMIGLVGMFGGLNSIAQQLGVNRIGASHQAGSDSLLTSFVFFELRRRRFRDDGSLVRASGVIFGLH